jgi:hypothetical protein
MFAFVIRSQDSCGARADGDACTLLANLQNERSDLLV